MSWIKYVFFTVQSSGKVLQPSISEAMTITNFLGNLFFHDAAPFNASLDKSRLFSYRETVGAEGLSAMETMRAYLERVVFWITGRAKDLSVRLHKVTGGIRSVSVEVKSDPLQDTKPIIVQPERQRPEHQRPDRGKRAPREKKPDRIFHIGLVALGLCFIALFLGGTMYLIIRWVMR
jgi:hypothetical protein